ncbi:hypothetical protein BBK36DRAFT_1119041 [Trichoderma citrinoviride]|uniref:Uncharacterized protein n=1 Tax=Trichoderma citrinoviride TaxID=58853 RepID=A0A2T4BAX4_9HYPO|nr:hypothetical protein BBK36DRAFT_1119041 [Trichoderma citrinoviride]PTB66438.1 hypothetical protein BBK36DRAFT_1119041 [Trichoderma citrinoviride]
MEELSSLPDSPAAAGGPLQMASPDRVNQRRDNNTLFATLRAPGSEGLASPVHDKISQFNSMSAQSRQLERKTADAALKRAMLGREEAEAEMRRLKDEARDLRQEIEEGKERERRVGERLETVMENYGRAKETHAHTQALWEKEIRRARKENFKAQSTIVKLQEDLKNTRAATKLLVEESLQQEREKGRARDAELFEAKYQASSLQDQLEQALERMKLVEQERDAYKVAAKNEEVARLAAEGRIPLPTEQSDDEFASPPRKRRLASTIRCRDPRVSLSTMEVVSSAASELEIEQLTEQLQWERQRADRAQEMIEFMQAECQMHCCPCSKSKRRTSMLAQQLPRATPERKKLSAEASIPEEKRAASAEPLPSPVQQQQELKLGKVRKGARRSTVFYPQEGVFRTVSEQEAIELEAQRKAEIVIEAHEEPEPEMPSPTDRKEAHQRTFAKTPSVEPSVYDFPPGRSSLMSLINAPRIDPQADSLPNLRSVPPPVPHNEAVQEGARASAKAIYTVTKTTTVPVKDERSPSSSSFSHQRMRTASNSSAASFDTSDPAMVPTMTREEALAQIRERRGRARSATRGGAATPQSRPTSGLGSRPTSGLGTRPTSGLGRRDISGPVGRVGSRSRSRNA